LAIDLLDQRLPPAVSRETRVRLLLTAATALRDGRPVPVVAGKFLGTALCEWLQSGGDLEREHLQVKARRGSHRTPTAIAIDVASGTAGADGAIAFTLSVASSR
jgi:hypothetical protein